MSQAAYEKMVAQGKEYILAGDVIQVVLSQRFSRPTSAEPLDIYRALRTINPSPYMFFLDLEECHIIGASPELLVQVEEGNVTTHPIAGTRWRGRTPEEDVDLEHELINDEKERAEHIMLVDLGRNDIRQGQPTRHRAGSQANGNRPPFARHASCFPGHRPAPTGNGSV